MRRARTHLTALVMLIVSLSATAGGRKHPAAFARPPADPLRAVLDKKGYVTVPLVQEEDGGCFRVACKSGTKPFLLEVDTGAVCTSLDMGLVKRLGLKCGDGVQTVGIEGLRKSAKVSLRGFSVGDFDTRAVANSLSLYAADYTFRNTHRDGRKLSLVDGLLGHRALDSAAAVIDYSTRTLYLRKPLDGLWPEVEGQWVATSGQDDGQERKIDPKAPPTLEFKDRRFRLSDGNKRYTFGLHVNRQSGDGKYVMVFFDPDQEFAEKLLYRAGGLLKLDGDQLTVCLCLDPAKAKGKLPEDFTAPAGSGHVRLEFQREKPRAGRPAGPADPLRAVLEMQGYAAVPLVQEDGGGWFTVGCRSGTETFQLFLDTGAERTALDTGVVKKLGLKPEREFTVIGTGGTVSGAEISLRGLMIGQFDTRAALNALPAAAVDFSPMNAARVRHQKLRPIDGCLGHSTLMACDAVIDYSTRTLYLRKPLDGLWPRIEGKWVATSVEDDGQQRVIDPSTPPRLEFKDRLFRLTYGGRQYMYGLHVKPEGKGRYTLALFDPVREFATTLDYKAGGLLKMDGDRLTVCLLLHPTKTHDKMPTDFTAPAGSGHVLLEFRREK